MKIAQAIVTKTGNTWHIHFQSGKRVVSGRSGITLEEIIKELKDASTREWEPPSQEWADFLSEGSPTCGKLPAMPIERD